MKTMMLTAGAAAMTMLAGSALAAGSSRTVTGPAQPIPYAQMDAYLKASPKARASTDWWSGQTAAGAGASTSASATTPAVDATTGATMDSAASSSSGASAGAVANTPTDAAPPSMAGGQVNPPNPAAPSSTSEAAPTTR